VREFDANHYLFFATKKGKVKKTPLNLYGNPRRDGIIAIGLETGDEILDVVLTDGRREVVLAKKLGKAIRFNETNVRSMGRSAHGVRGVTIDGADDEVVGMVVLQREDSEILAVTQNGYGKRSLVEDYRVTGRGGKGVITIKASERNGPLISIHEVRREDELMITTRNGIVIRLPLKDVSVLGRNTQGVRLINLEPGDAVADVARLITEDEDGAVVGSDVDLGAEAGPDPGAIEEAEIPEEGGAEEGPEGDPQA
jgi:DNA gyrase subunit A